MSAREIARAAGDRFFTAATPCRHGHMSVRTVSEGKCFECVRASWAKVRRRLGKQVFVPNDARRAAKAAGEPRYIDGKTCPHGHTGERWTHNSCCVTCTSLAAAKHNKEHDSARKWMDANPERARDHRRVARANRRAREQGGSYTASDVADILRLQRRRCAWCATKLTPGYHIDHVVPLARGGENARRNLQALCPPCNRRKSARDPIAFAQMEGRLL